MQDENEIQFGKFWDRVGAYLLDVLIIGALSTACSYLNILFIKSFWFYALFSIPVLVYKPLMESFYGATLGKMALRLKVTDHQFERIGIERSFLRSLILIAPSLFYFPLYYSAFHNPAILDAGGLLQFSAALVQQYPASRYIGNIAAVLFVIDVVVLASEAKQKSRSFKDVIAGTYVIKTKVKPQAYRS